jgi:hypothetical protein
MLKTKPNSLIALISSAVFLLLAIYLLVQDTSLVGPL